MDMVLRVYGETVDNLTDAMEVALRGIKDGNTSGMNRYDNGGYSFEIKGEPVESYALAINGDPENLREERYEDSDSAHDAISVSGDTVVGLDSAGIPVRGDPVRSQQEVLLAILAVNRAIQSHDATARSLDLRVDENGRYFVEGTVNDFYGDGKDVEFAASSSMTVSGLEDKLASLERLRDRLLDAKMAPRP